VGSCHPLNRRPGLDPGLGFSSSSAAPKKAKPRVKHGATNLEMSQTGPLSECRLLARNPVKLPGGFRVRPPAPLMTGCGWLAAAAAGAREARGRLWVEGIAQGSLVS